MPGADILTSGGCILGGEGALGGGVRYPRW